MRLVTIPTEYGPRACGVFEGHYVDVNHADPRLPSTVREILALGPEGVAMVERALPLGGWKHAPEHPTILAPIPDPPKIICLGLNYRDHAAETGAEPPSEPIIFGKFATTIVGPGAPILLPEASQQVDYEAELVVAIGRGGRDIPRERAMEHVGGYTVGNDVSARDWQLGKPGKQWMAGKTFDTFAPIGPALVTPDEVADPHALAIRARVNGETRQDSNTRELIFKIDEVIAYLSRICTLQPGDLIFTGTPPGVGMARKPPSWLQPGDVVEVEIEGLGTLTNPVARR